MKGSLSIYLQRMLWSHSHKLHFLTWMELHHAGAPPNSRLPCTRLKAGWHPVCKERIEMSLAACVGSKIHAAWACAGHPPSSTKHNSRGFHQSSSDCSRDPQDWTLSQELREGQESPCTDSHLRSRPLWLAPPTQLWVILP